MIPHAFYLSTVSCNLMISTRPFHFKTTKFIDFFISIFSINFNNLICFLLNENARNIPNENGNFKYLSDTTGKIPSSKNGNIDTATHSNIVIVR